jgi:glycerophosphoryl diester phosphodiesterase
MKMKYQRSNALTPLWFLLAFICVKVMQAEKTKDPFYIIAHMANNVNSLKWAVSQGANAIENDFQFNDDGQPTVVEHGDPCDCLFAITKSNICRQGLERQCAGPKASNDAAAQLQHVAHLNGVALYIVDPKVKAVWGSRLVKAGQAIVPFLDKNLFGYGYKGKVIIGSLKVNTYDYIQAAVTAANSSVHKDRYFFTFDGEGDDYQGAMSTLSRLTTHRVYGTGITAFLGETFYGAIESGVTGKSKGENGLTYIWTIDKESSMRDYINRGVQGLMTNRVGVAKRIVKSMGLKMAKPSTSIPVSNATIPPIDKCDCDYNPGGCMISWPAPSGKACECQYKSLMWTCEGSLVNCDISHPKCSIPDESKEACELGQGDCDGY